MGLIILMNYSSVSVYFYEIVSFLHPNPTLVPTSIAISISWEAILEKERERERQSRVDQHAMQYHITGSKVLLQLFTRKRVLGGLLLFFLTRSDSMGALVKYHQRSTVRFGICISHLLRKNPVRIAFMAISTILGYKLVELSNPPSLSSR